MTVLPPNPAPMCQPPTNPRQVYAGGATYCFRFADEATARAVLADYWPEDQ